MTSARYQFAKYLQSIVTGCSSNLWEISKITSNDQPSPSIVPNFTSNDQLGPSIEPNYCSNDQLSPSIVLNSTSNTKVPQICPSSRASWLSAMIALAPIGRVGRLPGSKHLEPDCVRQQTRRSWNSVLVISTAVTRWQALGYSFLSRWPMKVVGGLVCWLLCRCWARWAMLMLLVQCAVLDT